MSKKTRPTFTPEYRLKCAQLAVDQGYTIRRASHAMGVGDSKMQRWVNPIKAERLGVKPKATLPRLFDYLLNGDRQSGQLRHLFAR